MKNNRNKKAKIKNKHLIIGISSVVLATSILIGTGIGIDESKKAIKDDYVQSDTKPKKKNETIKVETLKNDELNFYCDNYGDKYYLYLEEDDMLELIEQAMKEVDVEYVKNGNKTCFSVKDNVYSQFTKYDILGILQTESTLRLVEIKDKNQSIFDVNNYAKFQGTDKDRNIYDGPGMLNEKALNHVINIDRKNVNKFDNYTSFTVEGKEIQITSANINPYDYVKTSGAKTQKEIEQAFKENVILNVKTIYCYLNRLVKDYVKEGSHDAELQKLLEYKQFKNISQEDAQKVFALIAYNNGIGITSSAMQNGTLFDKHTSGDYMGRYIINVEYASKVMNKSKQYFEQFENINGFNQ